jgi:3-dehydroquinate synthetase
MGMLDAALDFEQAINHQQGKNLLGCYHLASTILSILTALHCTALHCTASLITRHTLHGIAVSQKRLSMSSFRAKIC